MVQDSKGGYPTPGRSPETWRKVVGEISDPSQKQISREPSAAKNFEIPAAQGGSAQFEFENLKDSSFCRARKVDPKCREAYLGKMEFDQIFKMSREKFYAFPKWKQNSVKKEFGLF